MSNFQNELESSANAVQRLLSDHLTHLARDDEFHRPKRLIDAMRHATLNGGKRLRPFLVLQVGKLFNAKRENLLTIAAALECVHCYSLIHDDLPAMDDDDLRRGIPTVHKAFDEATAILAGDALLTLAFELLAQECTHSDPIVRLELISKLAKAAGLGGMVGGQMLDLQPETDDYDAISRMQSMKTGALINYACLAGGICGRANADQIKNLAKYGNCIGQAFQLADDILDVTATSAELGKNTDKDHNKGKQTQVSKLGVNPTRKLALKLVDEAATALQDFGDSAQILIETARFTINRNK